MKILVIDDEPQIARLFGRLLGGDVEVTVASGVTDALQCVDDQRFDAFVCDLNMPQLSGIDFYRRLAARRPGRERRIIFLTGGFFSEEKQRFFDAIDNPLVLKPFEIEEIQEALAAVL